MTNKIRKATVGLCAVLVSLGYGAAAWAQTADPTGGASGTFLTDIKNWIVTQGGLIIAGLLFVGAAWALVVKFAKRGTKTV